MDSGVIDVYKRQLLDRAHDFVEKATAGYEQREPVIPAAVCDELDYIVKQAVEEIGGPK